MIEGNLVVLRAMEEDDVVFHRWLNDPEVTRFLGIPFPTTPRRIWSKK
jgi:RimJ/RimL family protein N-acetyltransferase